ncbi:MAG: tRNA epoxyqueuosine(34) reductase QueG [Termitinemataceae bacterium]|nr:MAG: tRNA epoxyqueuosine(34) reductase QueG [Termitinemataceae bacterium]
MDYKSRFEGTSKKEILDLCAKEGFVKSAFCTMNNPLERKNPPEKTDSCFLVCALSFDSDYSYGDTKTKMPKHYGSIAAFARFNYYKEAVKHLKRIRFFLRKKFGGTKSDYKIFCNSALPEKKLAQAAGIGYMGKNNLIITKEAGSFVILAGIILPNHIKEIIKFETQTTPDQNIKNRFPLCDICAGDPACVAACPTSALGNDGKINLQACIQWYASGNGDNVPENVAANWGGVFYGCTKCQDVCPHNICVRQHSATTATIMEGALNPYIDVENFLSLTDDEIKKMFKGTALGLSWLTPKALRRNASLCCTHFRGAL